MPESELKYDVFLSHASEDVEWCEMLAKRLRDEGVRVWFDKWELRPGDHLLARLNDAIENSRKMIAVWTVNYFKDKKVWTLAESYGEQHSDVLAEQRPLIPLLREDTKIPPTLRNILSIDCRNDMDFDLRLREIVQAVDLPRREMGRREGLFDTKEYDLGPNEKPRLTLRKGTRFQDDVAELYRLLGFDVKQNVQLSGLLIDLMIEQKQGGMLIQAIVSCEDNRVTAADCNQVLAHQNILQKKQPAFRWIAVSSQSFTADARTALTGGGVFCATYAELLRELVPLEEYVGGLIDDYESLRSERWNGEDWFIRPDLVTDITFEKKTALEHIGKWLGDSRGNLMVVLGDLGAGKSTLAAFLAYNLAKSFRADPIRQPAPVLIPLKDVRKENTLESIVIGHFSRHGFQDINFRRFLHLVRLGKIVLFFDAFDEMADRVRSEITQSNFRELKRAAEQRGKVLLTCRTHYFKDRNEQVKVIGEGPKLSEIETDLYRELRQQSTAEVVYLQEFDDQKILSYLEKARPETFKEDWTKIQEIHNLMDLATRPLLLDMIVKSLELLDKGQPVNAANLYTVYTNIWLDREEEKGRFLDKRIKLALMLELASQMWNESKPAIHYHDLLPFLKKTAPEKMAGAGEEELLDIAREIQGASFLKRMDNEGNFAFMHRSFMEFFIARKLFELLVESEESDAIRKSVHGNDSAIADDERSVVRADEILRILDTNRLDRKVIYFLTLLDEHDRMSEPLQKVLTSGYIPRASENALQILYWSIRIRSGMEDKIPNPQLLIENMCGRIPTGAVLRTARLEGFVLEAAELSGVNFDGADLAGAKLSHAQLSDCSFFRAHLEGARLDSTSIRGVSFREANILDVSFDDANIDDADFTGAYGEGVGAVGSLGEQVVRVAAAIAGYGREALSPVVQSGCALNAVAFSPDGDLLATGGGDGVTLIYRRADGRLLKALEGHTDWVRSVAFSLDGLVLASGSDDQTVRLWDVKSGRPLRALEGHTNRVWSVAFSPDGESLASGGDDQTMRLWEVKSGRLLRVLEGHTGGVKAVAFSPNGESLASGSDDNSVGLWEVKGGRPLRALQGHTNRVMSVVFSPDSEIVASGSDDQSVRLWEVNGQRLLRSLEGHTDGVNSVAFSPNGECLASGSDDNSVGLWEVKSGRLLRALEGHTNRVWSVAFSPDGESLASGGDDQTVRLWEVKSGRLLRALEGHLDAVNSVVLSPSGERVATGSYDETVRLWELKSGRLLRALEGHTDLVRSVAFSPDGEHVASASNDKKVRLWEVKSGRPLLALEGHTDWVRCLAFSPDGEILTSGGDDKSMRVWQVKSGRLLRVLEGHKKSVNSVAFSPDGKTLASGSDDMSVRLWSAKKRRLFRTLKGHTGLVRSVIFSPDGKSLASGSNDKSVRLWELNNGRLIRALEGHTNWVRSLAFSPDGEILASGSNDSSVRLWEVKSGRLFRALTGNFGTVNGVSFAPNSKYLIAAGSAGRLQFWDFQTGETFLYRYSFGPGEWLDLLPDGRFDASPEGMRYLCYTERDSLNSFTAESLVKEFYDPQAVQDVLARYTSGSQ